MTRYFHEFHDTSQPRFRCYLLYHPSVRVATDVFREVTNDSRVEMRYMGIKCVYVKEKK